jgi:hypothetical protein
MAGQEDTCWRCGATWEDGSVHLPTNGVGSPGKAWSDVDDAARVLAVPPVERATAISGRA